MNLFQMKSRPHGIERLSLFLQDKFVAIGWPGIGSLENVNIDEIEERLAKEYPSYIGQTMSYYKGIVNAFANTMKKDDIIMVSEGDYVHFGRLGAYKYKKEFDNQENGMCHQRPVTWIETFQRNTLNEKVQEHLRNRATVTKFKYPLQLAELSFIFKEDSDSEFESKSSHSKQLLSEKSWEVLEKELQSDDAIVRVTAATAILNLSSK